MASQRPFDAAGQPLESTTPLPIAIDYEIEGEGARARLRLVHSGFGRGAEWDDEIEGVRRGWAFELRGLKHYLERHRGRERHAAWLFRTASLPEAAAWARLCAGYLGEPATSLPGAPATPSRFRRERGRIASRPRRWT